MEFLFLNFYFCNFLPLTFLKFLCVCSFFRWTLKTIDRRWGRGLFLFLNENSQSCIVPEYNSVHISHKLWVMIPWFHCFWNKLILCFCLLFWLGGFPKGLIFQSLHRWKFFGFFSTFITLCSGIITFTIFTFWIWKWPWFWGSVYVIIFYNCSKVIWKEGIFSVRYFICRLFSFKYKFLFLWLCHKGVYPTSLPLLLAST